MDGRKRIDDPLCVCGHLRSMHDREQGTYSKILICSECATPIDKRVEGVYYCKKYEELGTRDDILIAKQARAIASLTDDLEVARECMEEIKLLLVRIGGPLNDNTLQYSNEQLKVFHRILELVEIN
jgi:hypothetical protein